MSSDFSTPLKSGPKAFFDDPSGLGRRNANQSAYLYDSDSPFENPPSNARTGYPEAVREFVHRKEAIFRRNPTSPSRLILRTAVCPSGWIGWRRT